MKELFKMSRGGLSFTQANGVASVAGSTVPVAIILEDLATGASIRQISQKRKLPIQHLKDSLLCLSRIMSAVRGE